MARCGLADVHRRPVQSCKVYDRKWVSWPLGFAAQRLLAQLGDRLQII